MEIPSSLLILPTAFVLDLLLGDPRRVPHPVRWMGRMIGLAEPWFRRLPGRGLVSGGLLAAALVLGTWTLTWLAVSQCRQAHAALGFVLETVAVYFCLSVRSLVDAAEEILHLLQSGCVEEARARVAMIPRWTTAAWSSALPPMPA